MSDSCALRTQDLQKIVLVFHTSLSKLEKMIQRKPLYRAFEFSKHSADVGIVLVVQLPQALHCTS